MTRRRGPCSVSRNAVSAARDATGSRGTCDRASRTVVKGRARTGRPRPRDVARFNCWMNVVHFSSPRVGVNEPPVHGWPSTRNSKRRITLAIERGAVVHHARPADAQDGGSSTGHGVALGRHGDFRRHRKMIGRAGGDVGLVNLGSPMGSSSTRRCSRLCFFCSAWVGARIGIGQPDRTSRSAVGPLPRSFSITSLPGRRSCRPRAPCRR
jgi:hypothetical protein